MMSIAGIDMIIEELANFPLLSRLWMTTALLSGLQGKGKYPCQDMTTGKCVDTVLATSMD
jgi:hypothetical protein